MPFTAYFLTDHDPFRAYVFRLNRTLSPVCACGDLTLATHYIYNRHLTGLWNIRCPLVLSRVLLMNILSRPHLLSKLKNNFKFYVTYLYYSTTEPEGRFSPYSLSNIGSNISILLLIIVFFVVIVKFIYMLFVHHAALCRAYRKPQLRPNFTYNF